MATKSGCCSIPSGEIYIGLYAGLLQAAIAAGTYYPQLGLLKNDNAGVVDKCDVKFKLNEKKLPNSNSRAGGVACSAYWVDDCTVTMNIRCGKASNIALALLGRNNFIASGAVTNEDKVMVKNVTNTVQAPGSTFVPLNRIPDWTVLPVVTNIAGSTTYVLGTDYTLGESGLLIPPSSNIVSAVAPYTTSTMKVSYTALDTLRTDGLVYTPEEVSILCDGFDRASGAQLQTHIYRAQGMADGMPVITDDFINLSCTFTMLADSRIPLNAASPTSQYFHQLRG